MSAMSEERSLDVVICWFRRDLRTYDNPALIAALNSARTVIPLYIWSPEEEVSSRLVSFVWGAGARGINPAVMLMPEVVATAVRRASSNPEGRLDGGTSTA